VTRVKVQNHWNPVTKRWAIDAGDTIDMGTTAVPNLFASGVLVTAAGRDFVEIHDPLDPVDLAGLPGE
jgi:hypothetical protein